MAPGPQWSYNGLVKGRNWQRLAALIAVAFLLTAASSQQLSSVRLNKTFTSPDGEFRFRYPGDFQLCTKGKLDACRTNTMIPTCDNDALVCVIYPEQVFETMSSNIQGMTFEVRNITDKGFPDLTADQCVTPRGGSYYENFLISAEHPVEVINGVSFIHGSTGSAAGGSSSETDLYRALHKRRCFELSISSGLTNVADDGHSLAPAVHEKMYKPMSDILHSFRFTN